MSFYTLSMQDESGAEVEFDASADGAVTELATDAIEVQDVVNEAGEVADAIDEGVEIVEAAESMIVYGQMIAAGQPVSKSGQYQVEHRYEAMRKKAPHLFSTISPITTLPEFESATDSESALRARAIEYAGEGFAQEATRIAKQVIAWIVAAFDKVVMVVRKLFQNAGKVKKSLEDLKSKLGKTEDYRDAAADKEIKVNAKWLNNGSKVDPTAAVESAEKAYNEAAKAASKLTGEAKGKFEQIAKGEVAGIDKILEDQEQTRTATFKPSALGKISGHPLGFSNGKLVVGAAPSISKNNVEVMGRTALISFIDKVISLAGALEKQKDTVKEAEKAKADELKLINDIAKKMEKESTDEAKSAETAELRRRITSLTKVSAAKDMSSLTAVSGAAYQVLFAALSLAHGNAKALVKKKSS